MFVNVSNINKDIKNQLARNYWNQSQRAKAENHFEKALHYTAEAINLSTDKDLTRNLLIDFREYDPEILLKTVFLEPESFNGDPVNSAVFNLQGNRILTHGIDGST